MSSSPAPSPPPDPGEYELLDAGDGRRLERFGSVVVDRPAPTALDARRDAGAWRSADLRFDPDRGWSGRALARETGRMEPWHIRIDGLTMELRPTSSGGLGLFPEHAASLDWLSEQIDGREQPAVLNLFAHTGLVTLGVARAGAAVAHVDGARSAVAWARRNAELSGLTSRPIRWLVDDATAFIAREARRGRRYHGIVLDPPSFGHARGRRWRLEDALPALLDGCADLLAPDGFVLLTAHTTGLDASTLEGQARAAFESFIPAIETRELALVAASGAQLDLGWSVRLTAR